MNITREDLPGRQIALTIELEPEVVNTALDRAYRQMVNQINVPGFRKGKAPRHIVESYVGKDMLTERAVKNMLPQTVRDAIDEQKIEAMDVGEVEIVNLDPLQVKVVVIQPPKIELGDYSGLRIEKVTTEITEKDVEDVLAELRRESAPWEEPSEPRPIEEGDMVYLDLEGFTTEGPLDEASRENFPTIVGVSRAGVPEVVNPALKGLSVGEEKDIADTLPDDYPNEALRGKDVTYHVTVRSIKCQELPEMDDEFAKKTGYDTMAALREAVDRNLRDRATEAAETEQVNKAISSLVESSQADIPDVMVNEELDAMLKRLENRLKEQRLNLRQFLTYSGMTEEDWREANRERARVRVVQGLVLQEFARNEEVAVDEGEIDSEVEGILERYEGAEKEQAQSVLTRHEARHDLEDRLFQRKIIDRLVSIAEGRTEAKTVSGGSKSEEKDTEAEVEAAQPREKKGSSKKAASSATDIEEAGGAAELLNEGGEARSELETGAAASGGTPAEAPQFGGSAGA